MGHTFIPTYLDDPLTPRPFSVLIIRVNRGHRAYIITSMPLMWRLIQCEKYPKIRPPDATEGFEI